MLTNQEVKKVVEELCGSVASLFPQNQIEAILFGSYARSNAEPGSDIDVLILVDASRQDISARNWQVGRSHPAVRRHDPLSIVNTAHVRLVDELCAVLEP